MVARSDQPVGGRIEGLRRIGSKGNTGGTFGLGKFCQRLPRFLDQPCPLEGRLVCSPAPGARRLQRLPHSLPSPRRALQK